MAAPQNGYSYTFEDAIKEIKKHDSTKILKGKAKSIYHAAEKSGSWGDPMFRIVGKNYPIDSMDSDVSPMTGIEYGISQKIALTTKYGNKKKSMIHQSNSEVIKSRQNDHKNIRDFWFYLIDSKKTKEQIIIFEESLNWYNNTLKVSNRLYSNGKITQQALLDLKIRKSEIETQLVNKRSELEELNIANTYLVSLNGTPDHSTIPWNIINKTGSKEDFFEKSLIEKLEAKKISLASKNQNFVPDLNVSLGYTKRNELDGLGDFVSLALTMQLPLSSTKFSEKKKAMLDKTVAKLNLDDYKKFKSTELRKISEKTKRLMKHLDILKNQTIQFAKNARKITTTSYSHGNSSYLELQNSEIKLQKLELQKSNIEAKLLKNKISYKFLNGEKLYE
jgi:hypothetical protein